MIGNGNSSSGGGKADKDGKDDQGGGQGENKGTLVMSRTPNENLSDKHTNVWNVSLSFVTENSSTPLKVNGKDKFFMFGAVENDNGFNGLNDKKSYPLSFNKMKGHQTSEWENTIQVGNSNVFIHIAKDISWLGGCKGLCTEFDRNSSRIYEGVQIFQALDNVQTLQSIRTIYQSFENQLTGEKFILTNVQELPNASSSQVKPNRQFNATDNNAGSRH